MKRMKKIFLVTILFCITFVSKTMATSTNLYSTDRIVTSGQDKNIVVNIISQTTLSSYTIKLKDAGGLNLLNTSGGDEVSESTVSYSGGSSSSNLATYTFEVPEVYEKKVYKIVFSINMKNANGEETSINNTATITVNPKEETTNTIKEETKSSNNYLSSLTVGKGTLTPEFSKDVYQYKVNFDNSVNLFELSQIEIKAKAEDDKASIAGIGMVDLKEGENKIAVTVTSENGSVRTYTINITKPTKEEEQSYLRLRTLVINGINNNGEYQNTDFTFDPNTFEYNITVPNDIKAISVNPTTEDENIIIETNGGSLLVEGKNKIIIILTSPNDDTIKTTYTINVEKEAAKQPQGLTKEQKGMIFIGTIIGIFILILVVILIIRHNKKKKIFDYYDDEDDFTINYINNKENKIETEEDPYPKNIKVEDEYEDKENIVNKNEIDNNTNFENINEKEENIKQVETLVNEEMPTVDNIKPAKLRWDDVLNSSKEIENEKESKKGKEKKKGGKRFL